MNYKKLMLRISNNIELAKQIKYEFETLHSEGRYLPHDRFSSENIPTEKQLILEEEFEGLIKSAYRKISLIFDLLKAEKTYNKFEINFEKIKPITKLEYHSTYDICYMKSLSLIEENYNILNDLLVEAQISDLDLVNRILKNTNKIIFDTELDPTSEKDVKVKVRNTLSYYFSDVVQEMHITNVCKTFKPDIGLKSLQLAIEYKYATTKEEVKTIIGGIYEDIGGYSESKDWTNFIAVLYLTEPFYTEDQINEQFSKKGFPKNWKITTVFGTGSRKKNVNK